MEIERVPAQPDDPEAWAVADLLIRFMRSIHELNQCDLRHGGLSPQQVRAMLYLVHHGGARIKELAQALSLSEARASRLAEELAEMGLVSHRRDTADRRQVLLHVAPDAAERARRIYNQRMGAVQRALAGAPEDELRTFTQLLGRVVGEFESLTRELSAGAPTPRQPVA